MKQVGEGADGGLLFGLLRGNQRLSLLFVLLQFFIKNVIRSHVPVGEVAVFQGLAPCRCETFCLAGVVFDTENVIVETWLLNMKLTEQKAVGTCSRQCQLPLTCSSTQVPQSRISSLFRWDQ